MHFLFVKATFRNVTQNFLSWIGSILRRWISSILATLITIKPTHQIACLESSAVQLRCYQAQADDYCLQSCWWGAILEKLRIPPWHSRCSTFAPFLSHINSEGLPTARSWWLGSGWSAIGIYEKRTWLSWYSCSLVIRVRIVLPLPFVVHHYPHERREHSCCYLGEWWI